MELAKCDKAKQIIIGEIRANNKNKISTFHSIKSDMEFFVSFSLLFLE